MNLQNVQMVQIIQLILLLRMTKIYVKKEESQNNLLAHSKEKKN